MKRKQFLISIALLIAVASIVFATDGFKRIREKLTGYEEVPAVSTGGSGQFRGRINDDGTEVDWTLSYDDLEGAVQQAHIHFGQKGVNGGITVFLCTNLGNGPVGTQACPASPSTVSGTLTAADVSPNIPATQGARNQGMGTGEFEEFLEALREGSLYVNVHSTTWPGGEVRSQIDGHKGNHGDRDRDR